MKKLIIALFTLMLVCTFSVTYAQEQEQDLVQRALDKTREMSDKAKNKYIEHKEKKKDHFKTISGIDYGQETDDTIDKILDKFSKKVGGIKGLSTTRATSNHHSLGIYTITIWY